MSGFVSKAFAFLWLFTLIVPQDCGIHNLYDESAVPQGTKGLNISVNLPIDKLQSSIGTSSETIDSVYVENVPITAEHVRYIFGFPNLTRLSIVSETVTNEYRSFTDIPSPTKLISLRITDKITQCSSLESDDWKWIWRINSLQSLDLEIRTKMEDSRIFARLPNLDHIALGGDVDLSEGGLSGLRESTSLEGLTIEKSDRLILRHFQDLSAIPNLQRLFLSETSSIENFGPLKDAKHLEYIVLKRCGRYSEACKAIELFPDLKVIVGGN